MSLTITTADDELYKKVEPGVPPSLARLRAMHRLSKAGIETRVALMLTLPFIEDSWENVSAIIAEAHRCGAKVVIPWFEMSVSDWQRAYSYHRLDESFPGLRRGRYEAAYREDYMCPSLQAEDLYCRAQELCARLGIATQVKLVLAPTAEELRLFD